MPNPRPRWSRKTSICPENPINPKLAHIVKSFAVLLGLLTSMPAAAALIIVKREEHPTQRESRALSTYSGPIWATPTMAIPRGPSSAVA